MALQKSIVIKKKRATYEYNFINVYEAGIQLLGTEVKSIRDGNANLNDAYCFFDKGELYIKNMYIAEYKMSAHFQHDLRRDRKLLLKKAELKKMQRRAKEKGFAIVPFKVYFNDRGIAKLKIALAQGKKSYDKRESIKKRDIDRELKRTEKYYL